MQHVNASSICIVSRICRLADEDLGRLHRHSMRFTVDEAEVHSFVGFDSWDFSLTRQTG